MSTPSPGLKSGSIGLIGAATLGMVFLSPAMTLYGLFGPTYLAVRNAAPLVFILGLLVTLPTAFSYAILSRDFPSSGSTADWSARATGPRVGEWTAWLVFLYYLTNFVIQVVAVGMFFNELLLALGVHIHPGLGFTVGVLLGSAWPAYMVYRGLSISVKGALLFLAIEMLTVLALCGTVLAVAPSRGAPITLEGFSVPAAAANPSGVFTALVFALLGFCGFDVVSTLAEETKAPRTLIPRATLLALFLYAILIVFGMWALTVGADAKAIQASADAGGAPIVDVARGVWGRGSIIVTFTALSATLGLIVATAVGASRVLFANGRRASAAGPLARLHPRFQVPWNALHVIFAVGIVGTLALALSLGIYNAYVWACNTSVFFAMLTFLFSNLAAILLNRHRIFTSAGGLLMFLLVPSIGIAADLYIIVQSFFIDLWSQPWATGKSVIVFDVACTLVALAYALLRPPHTPNFSTDLTPQIPTPTKA